MLIVIGDIHGCHDELLALLDRIGPSRDDTIVSVGDLIDRGPKPLDVVRFFRDTPGARAVMGNHEDKHLRWAAGNVRPASSRVRQGSSRRAGEPLSERGDARGRRRALVGRRGAGVR